MVLIRPMYSLRVQKKSFEIRPDCPFKVFVGDSLPEKGKISQCLLPRCRSQSWRHPNDVVLSHEWWSNIIPNLYLLSIFFLTKSAWSLCKWPWRTRLSFSDCPAAFLVLHGVLAHSSRSHSRLYNNWGILNRPSPCDHIYQLLASSSSHILSAWSDKG
jgi:hypothetical protein